MNESASRPASFEREGEVIDLTGLGPISRPGQAQYTKVSAEAMQGRMLASRHDQGVYGKVVGMTGYRETKGSEPIYALNVQWTRKPHQALSDKGTIFRNEVGRQYPVLSGTQEKVAQRVWDHHHGPQQAASQSSGFGR